MATSDRRIDDVGAAMKVSDGRLIIEAEDGDARVYVKWPDLAPLSVGETHATIRVVGEDMETTVELDGEQLDALEGAIHTIQDRVRGEEADDV